MIRASLRDAIRFFTVPWVKTHGYYRPVAIATKSIYTAEAVTDSRIGTGHRSYVKESLISFLVFTDPHSRPRETSSTRRAFGGEGP
jgi:hypothetical protein